MNSVLLFYSGILSTGTDIHTIMVFLPEANPGFGIATVEAGARDRPDPANIYDGGYREYQVSRVPSSGDGDHKLPLSSSIPFSLMYYVSSVSVREQKLSPQCGRRDTG